MSVDRVRQTGLSSIAAVIVIGALLPSYPVQAQPAGRPITAATFTSQDPRGCVSTEVSVFVRGNGKAIGAQTKLTLSILKVNECEDTVVVQAEGRSNLRAGAFFLSPNLDSARLETTVPVRNRHTGGTLTATVRLSWTALEKAVVAAQREEPDGPGKFIRMKSPVERTLRLAAATGTVSIGAGTLTPTPAETAWLSLARGGQPADGEER